MSAIIALFTRPVLAIVGGVAVAGALFLALQLGIAHGQIKGLKRDLTTTNDAWNACKAEKVSLKVQRDDAYEAVNRLSLDIQTWKLKADKAEEAKEKAVRKARSEADQYRRDGDRIASADVTGDKCTWALNLHQVLIGKERGR